MKKIIILLLFFIPVIAQDVSSTQLTEQNLKEATFYSRIVSGNVVWIGESDATAGSADRTGYSIQARVNTITKAITQANALTPGVGNQVSIVIIDARTYSETATLPDYVDLIYTNATVSNTTAGTTSSSIIKIGGSATWGEIVGTLSNQTDLQSALDGKEPAFTKNTAFNKNFGTGTTNVPEIGVTLGNTATVETDGTGKLITATKNTAYNKSFGTGTTNVPEIGSTLGNTETVNTDASGKLITEAKGTAFNKNFGTGTTNIAEIGATLGNTATVETDASGKLITATKNTGYNKNFGNITGTVKEGFKLADSSVTGFSKSGSAVLKGDVTLSEGSGVTLTQSGNDIEIAAAGGGGSTILTAYKASDETVNNSSTYQNDDDLVIALEANSVYQYELILRGEQASASPSFKARFDFPTGSTNSFQSYYQSSSFLTFYSMSYNSTFGIVSDGSPWAFVGSTPVARSWGVITTSTTAGNLTLQWAQISATAADTKVLAGSYLKIIKLN